MADDFSRLRVRVSCTTLLAKELEGAMTDKNFKSVGDVEVPMEQKTSRRQLLTGGSVIIVGAIATAIAGGVKAGPPACANPNFRNGILCKGNDIIPIVHHHNDPALVSVVVRAWTFGSYETLLLDPLTAAEALKWMGVEIPAGYDPVVLDQREFESNGYQVGPNDDVVLYVLPTPPVGGGTTGQAARDAMAAVPFGM
jgi:hypothetical protein